MTSWTTSPGRSLVRLPAHLTDDRRRRRAPCRGRTRCPDGVAHVDHVALVEVAADPDDAGRQQRTAPLDQRAASPRRRRAPCPRRGWRTRSTACAPAAAGRSAGTSCRRRRAGDGVDQHVGRVRRGDDRPHARPRGDPRRGQLRRHPAAAARRCRWRRRRHARAAGRRRRPRRSSGRSGPWRGSAVYRPGVSVSSTQQLGVHVVGDERGDAVVVAEADLVAGDGVVLVDDRHAAEVEQAA